jgi:hypothetical protein
MKCDNCYHIITDEEEHFLSYDGRVLCSKCSIGVILCSDKVKELFFADKKEETTKYPYTLE